MHKLCRRYPYPMGGYGGSFVQWVMSDNTIGTTIDSMAEALWGVPQWMEEKAMQYLSEDMKSVLNNFRNKICITLSDTKRHRT